MLKYILFLSSSLTNSFVSPTNPIYCCERRKSRTCKLYAYAKIISEPFPVTYTYTKKELFQFASANNLNCLQGSEVKIHA